MADLGKIENIEYLAGYGSTHTASLCSCTQNLPCVQECVSHAAFNNR